LQHLTYDVEFMQSTGLCDHLPIHRYSPLPASDELAK